MKQSEAHFRVVSFVISWIVNEQRKYETKQGHKQKQKR